MYFAGHGIQLFDRNYLLSVDVDPAKVAKLDDLGIELGQTIETLRTSGAHKTLFIIDACRNNPFTFDQTVSILQRLRDELSAPASAIEARLVKRGLAPVSLPAGRQLADSKNGTGTSAETQILFAAQPGHTASDASVPGAANSPLAESIAQELQKQGRGVTEALRAASVYVRNATSGQQVPQFVSDWSDDVALTPASSKVLSYQFNGSWNTALSEQEKNLLIKRDALPMRFHGDFIVVAALALDEHYSLSEDERKSAANSGHVTGSIITYDLDRDGKPEKIVLARGPWNDPTLRVLIEVDGVSIRVPTCFPAIGKRIEIGLKDLNHDRRPELWIADESGLCILEFKSFKQLPERQRQRNDQQPKIPDPTDFMQLLSVDAFFTDSISANTDGTITICGGTGCHRRTVYKYSDGRFSEQPKSDGVEDPNNDNEMLEDIKGFIRSRYLANSIPQQREQEELYADVIEYHEKSFTKKEMARQVISYIKSWQKRDYQLKEDSLIVSPKSGSQKNVRSVKFDFTYAVQNARGQNLCGSGSVELHVIRHSDSFRIKRIKDRAAKLACAKR